VAVVHRFDCISFLRKIVESNDQAHTKFKASSTIVQPLQRLSICLDKPTLFLVLPKLNLAKTLLKPTLTCQLLHREQETGPWQT
jgi:hypothetical protein